MERRLDAVRIETRPGFAVSVVLASQGYPGSYAKGKQITVGELPKGKVVCYTCCRLELTPSRADVVAFHAGTTSVGNAVVTSGGRVIAVSAYAPTLQGALDAAYAGVDSVQFDGKTFRRDIAHRFVLEIFSHVILVLISLCSALKANIEAPKLTYSQAGVSVDAGNSLVEQIKPFVRATRRSGADAEIGGFGGVFDLKATGYVDPVLVSGTDGVGTKLKVAIETGIHDFVGKLTDSSPSSHRSNHRMIWTGIDLVAMSVNDLIVQGAEPLYFLDYFACSKLDVDQAAKVVKGIAEGCRGAGCALIGGETAEMPGMYHEGKSWLRCFYHEHTKMSSRRL